MTTNRISFLSPEYSRIKKTLVKACGIKKQYFPTILDITAGMGRDAFSLALSGCQVTMLERHPMVAKWLEEALKELYCPRPQFALLSERTSLSSTLPESRVATPSKAQIMAEGSIEELTQDIHLDFHFIDAEMYLQNLHLDQYPDVILIDPMHPERRKSALVKKSMQILQSLIPPEEHPEHLVDLALQYAKKRVVLKWPRKAPALSYRKPDFVYLESIIRYEIYLKRGFNGLDVL